VKGTFPDAAGTFTYTGSSEPLRLSAKAENGSFTAAVGRMDLTGHVLIDPGAATLLMPYRSEAKISDMTVQVGAPARGAASATSFGFSLRGVTGTTESKIAKDLWSYSSHMQGRLETEGMAIDKFEVGSALRNVHVPTVTKLTEAWMSRGFSCDQDQPLDEPLAQLEQLAASAFELLPYGPEYQVGPLAIELGGKRAEVSYVVGIHGVASGSAPPPIMQLVMDHAYARAEAKVHLGLIDSLAAWAQSLRASTAGTAPRHVPVASQGAPHASARMARALIDGFVQQGFLERDADFVRGRIEVDAGTFKLNGRPFQLPDFDGFGADADAVRSLIQTGGAPDADP
jgi:hypothetical protein